MGTARENFNASDYGHKLLGVVEEYCRECESVTVKQIACYLGVGSDKVSFCTYCGKTFVADDRDIEKALTGGEKTISPANKR